MKVHLLQVLVIDHDAVGADEVERILEDANYPNDCIAPSVIKSQSVEIGEWEDDNPLNHSDTQVAEVDRLFSAWQSIETAPRNKRILVCTEDNVWINKLNKQIFESELLGWMHLPNPPQD
jgi:hypothetical protein